MEYKITYTVKEQYERKRHIIVQNIVPCFLKGKTPRGFAEYQSIYKEEDKIRIVKFCQSIEGLKIFTDLISFEMAKEKIVDFVEKNTNTQSVTSSCFFSAYDDALKRNNLKRY